MIEFLITYIFTAFSFYNHIFFYKLIRNNKTKIIRKCIFMPLMIPLITFFVNKLNNPILSLLINLVLFCLLIKLTFNISMKEALYFSIIINIFCMFCDSLISIVIGKSNINFFKIFYQNKIYRSFLTIPVFTLTFFIFLIKKVRIFLNNIYDKYIFKIKITVKFALGVIFAVLSFILFCLINAYLNANSITHFFIIIDILIFIIIFYILIKILYKEYQTKMLSKKIMEENKYMKDIARQEKEFKHNLINNLLGIKTVASKKVNQLIDELISEYKTDYKKILNINDLPDGILSIIYRKAYEENMDNLNLVVDNKIKKDLIDILSPKNYNKFCTSIGILFDNALDAVKSCKEKIIEINFLEDKEYIYYIQKNSFNNVIDLERTGTKEYTTKKSGHGIGLNYVKKLKNIETKNEVINNMFITKLKVKKIKM